MKRRELLDKAKAEAKKIDSGEALAIFLAAKRLGVDLVRAAADGRLSLKEAAVLASDLRELAEVIDQAREDA